LARDVHCKLMSISLSRTGAHRMNTLASKSRVVLAASLLLFGLAACKDKQSTPTPATIAATGAVALTGTVGAVLPDLIEVKVTDASGNPVGGSIVTFTVADGGGTVSPAIDTTDSRGIANTSWRLGTLIVGQRLTAQVVGVATVVNFVATATAAAPATIALQSGDNQSAATGAAVATAPSVVIRDRFTNPVSGVSVFFSVATGGGTVTGTGATTNANGIASVGEWRLGPVVGVNRLTALAVSNGVTNNPITFTANGIAGGAASVTAPAGTTINGTVGAAVTPIPSVRVLDANGNAVSGVTVTFAASSGSAVVNGTKTTDAQGNAAPDSWVLGNLAQNYTLTATVGTLTPVVFTATARPATATQVTIFAGNAQSATVGRTVAIDPAVRVTDAFSNPIAGVEVVFDVITGDGSAVARRPLTNANGVATVGGWTLGDTPGPNTLRATVTANNITGNPVTFTATGTPGLPATSAIVSGNSQTAVAGSALPVALSVVVRDSRGNPVNGATVTFIPSAGTVTGGTVVTTSNGIATLSSWTLGINAGVQTLIARVNGLPDLVFSATATAGTASLVQALTTTSLGSFAVGAFVTPAPSVVVKDANGNPIANAQVVFTPDNGASILVGATKTTGADGIATLTQWQLGNIAGVFTVRALVTGLNQNGNEPVFTATALPGAATQLTIASNSVASQAATPSAPVTTVPRVRVTDAFGNGIANVTVTFTANNGVVGNATAVTDGNGFASAGSWTMPAGTGTRTLTASVGGTGISGNPLTFTATVSAGAPTQITATSSATQAATASAAVGSIPVVRVTDALGNGVAGVTVTFTANNGTVGSTTATTDANGFASAGSWTMPVGSGTRTLTATASGSGITGNPVTFTATVP